MDEKNQKTTKQKKKAMRSRKNTVLLMKNVFSRILSKAAALKSG